MTGKGRTCSPKCRTKRHRQQLAEVLAARDGELRRLLGEARTLLAGHGQRFYFSADRDRELGRLIEVALRVVEGRAR